MISYNLKFYLKKKILRVFISFLQSNVQLKITKYTLYVQSIF